MSVVITMPSALAPHYATERIHDNDRITKEALMQVASMRDELTSLHAELASADPRNPLEESAFLAVRTDLRLCDSLLRDCVQYLRGAR